MTSPVSSPDRTSRLTGPALPKIAIVKLSSLGDVIHALPVAHALRRSRPGIARLMLVLAAAATLAGGWAALAGPQSYGMDPGLHAYPAIVWVLVVWVAVHAALGVIMQLYALARSVSGRMTAVHDGDVRNVALYLHFLALSALVTFTVLAYFPRHT